jgi:hypothetical protein
MRLTIRFTTRLAAVAALAFAPAVFAQHTHAGSYGNVLHPGVPSPGGLRPPAPVGPNAGARIGAGGARRFIGGGAVYIPYPVYSSGYGMGYGMGYASDGFYATDYNQGPGYADAAPSPTVIINQNFQTDSVRPQFRDYSNMQLPEPGTVVAPPAAGPSQQAGALADDQPTIFLIAMQDHTIRPVIAYWVQGDTLNYISQDGVMNHVSLALVDRDFSKQLNAQRNVPFALPAAR